MTKKKALFLTTCVIGGVSAFAATSARADDYQPYYRQVSVQEQVAPNAQSGSSVASTGSFFSPMSKRIMSDPMYLPSKGQVYGVTAYTYAWGSSDGYNHLGVNTTSGSTHSNTFTQTLAYGVTDDVTLRLADSYAFGDNDSNNLSTDATTTSNVAGLTNPTLSATYRFVDQEKNNPVSADAYVAYSPNTLTSRNAGGGNTGTEASGRQTATLQADVGREMKGFTIEGIAGATFEGKRDFIYQPSNNSGSVSPFWAYYLAADTQTRLTDRFSVNGNIRWNILDNTSGANNNTGLTWTQNNADNVDFTVAFNYHFIPNRLVGQLSYDNVMYTNTSYTYSVPADNSETKNQDSNIFGVRLMYAFN